MRELRERRAAAHRLALSPSWRGTPSQKLKGVEGLTDLVPDSMLDRDAAQKPLIERIPGQPLPQVPLPPGGRLGENIDAEVSVCRACRSQHTRVAATRTHDEWQVRRYHT